MKKKIIGRIFLLVSEQVCHGFPNNRQGVYQLNEFSGVAEL